MKKLFKRVDFWLFIISLIALAGAIALPYVIRDIARTAG